MARTCCALCACARCGAVQRPRCSKLLSELRSGDSPQCFPRGSKSTWLYGQLCGERCSQLWRRTKSRPALEKKSRSVSRSCTLGLLFSSVFRLFFGRALSAFSEGLIGADTCEKRKENTPSRGILENAQTKSRIGDRYSKWTFQPAVSARDTAGRVLTICSDLQLISFIKLHFERSRK